MIIERSINLSELLTKRSHFLFGPRQTGKTSLISHQLAGARIINLLESDTYLAFSTRPQLLREQILEPGSLVVIDEVQKLPILLDEVHHLIESRQVRFLLTGSSARALKRRGINMLGGRARSVYLHPFSWNELKSQFSLPRALLHGLLPGIYFSENPQIDLQAYVGDYLKEEIAAEGAARNMPAFSRFLQVAAFSHGKLINFENIARDAQIAGTTIREYFQILKDTMLGYDLAPWGKGEKRKAVARHKFYFFDNGVAQRLQNRKDLAAHTPEYGDAFEAFIFHEIKSWLDYRNSLGALSFWRTSTGLEVDYILDDAIAIEVKASARVPDSALKALHAIKEEARFKRYIVVSLETARRKLGHIEILPLNDFLSELWSGELG